MIKEDDLQTDRAYILTVKSKDPYTEVQIVIHQNFTATTLRDGVPISMTFDDEEDVSKYFIFAQNENADNLIINLVSETPEFFPTITFEN